VYQGITGFLSVYGNEGQMVVERVILYDAADRSPDELCLYLHSLITQLQLQMLNRHRSEQALSRLDAVNRDSLIRHLSSTLRQQQRLFASNNAYTRELESGHGTARQ